MALAGWGRAVRALERRRPRLHIATRSAAPRAPHPKCLMTRASIMSRQSPFGHPFLLGFDEIEQALDRVAKAAGDGYPPYNIERLPRTERDPERLRITLAVVGFTQDQL